VKTLLVGLDNPNSTDPSHALSPLPSTGTGGRLLELIREHEPEYGPRDYLSDFFRTNLYPTRRAHVGKGMADADRDQIAFLRHYVEQIDVPDVVLLGNRVVAAFNSLYDEDLNWLKCRVIADGNGPRRFWALPHPSGRNRWYNDADNYAAAGKLLVTLARSRTPFTESLEVMP